MKGMKQRKPPSRSTSIKTFGDNSVTQVSTVTSNVGNNNTTERTIAGLTIFGSRIVFITTLLSVATSFGYLSYYLLSQSEHELTEVQFASIADRAVCSAIENFERKRLGTVSLASVVGGANPHVENWPFATLNNYETIATNLIDTSKGCNMAFAPIVQLEQIESYEQFAYDYYEKTRLPEPFPAGTANASSFGKGIWSMDMSLNNTDYRYHDVTGETSYGSPNQIVTPMFQHSQGPSKNLMMNLHSSPLLGGMIDDMLQCAATKIASNGTIDDCTAITSFKDNATSWTQQIENGPGANIIQPIYPSNDPTTMTGVIVSQLVWGEIMVDTYAKGVNGIDIVLTDNTQDENGTLNYYTYHVINGETKLVGRGDLHNRKFDRLGVTTKITSAELLGVTSASYSMTLYPSQQLYDVYTTKNPTVASLGCVLIIAFTSLMFLLYDILVRKEFHAKQDLLDAKRKFVRFVSHEVRTPLNSVCMGLTLLKDDIYAFKQQNVSSNSSSPTKKGTGQCPTKQWLTLTEEVAANAHSAVDVLNDFLNYDKVETGKLTLELGIVKMFDLIENTVVEFKLPAAKKKLKLTVTTPLTRSTSLRQTKGTLGTPQEDEEECYVIGDVIRLTQVLRNLVSNSVKFTPEDGAIEVSAQWVPPSTRKEIALSTSKYTQFELNSSSKDQQQNCETLSLLRKGTLHITVKDTGAGMTQEQVQKVFSQGTQFNVNTLQAGNGSGLGTYIAKGIVKQHGGTLSATSDGIGQGTTFTVTLPIYNIPHNQEQVSCRTFSKSRLNHQASNKSLTESMMGEVFGTLKILVVDDAKMNLKLLMRLLEKEGHDVDGAEDGVIAVAKTKAAMDTEQEYDVILMDYQMPNMDGPTAARTIRELGCYAFLVGVTGNVMPEDIDHFKKHGANAVLPKPIKIPDLKDLWVEYGVRGRNEDTTLRDESVANISFDLESIRTVVGGGGERNDGGDDHMGKPKQQLPLFPIGGPSMPMIKGVSGSKQPPSISSPSRHSAKDDDNTMRKQHKKKKTEESPTSTSRTSRVSMTGELVSSSSSSRSDVEDMV